MVNKIRRPKDVFFSIPKTLEGNIEAHRKMQKEELLIHIDKKTKSSEGSHAPRHASKGPTLVATQRQRPPANSLLSPAVSRFL